MSKLKVVTLVVAKRTGATEWTCDDCQAFALCLFMDSSSGEYGPSYLCETCIGRLFQVWRGEFDRLMEPKQTEAEILEEMDRQVAHLMTYASKTAGAQGIARARAYALCTIGGAPGDSDDREGMAKAYLAGARAEVELERKRIGDALAAWFTAHMADQVLPQHWVEIVKIIEGDK